MITVLGGEDLLERARGHWRVGNWVRELARQLPVTRFPRFKFSSLSCSLVSSNRQATCVDV